MYLQNNISDLEFLNLLNSHIDKKIPLSFTRFGDGEIYFINDNVPKNIENEVKTNWNYSNFIEAKKDILKIINTGLQKSNIIGLMNPANDIAKRIKFSYDRWSIKKEYINKLRNDNFLIADHMITRSNELGNIYNFKEIIKNNDIAIISPRIELLKKNKIHKILNVNVNYIYVPLGVNLKNRSFIFNELNKIQELIVLYGCSITGKDFGVYLCEHGKIALDFGATLDAWCGLNTRKWFNNIQNHCFIKNKE